MEEENESESIEEIEKYLQEAKFRMKNNKFVNRDNVNNNFLGNNNINNINIGSSIATASFNNGINSLNNNYHFSNSIDDNKLNNFQSGEIKNENFKESSFKNNNIKGSVISMKDILLKKSSSIKIDSNIYDNINNKFNNRNNDINNNTNNNIINNINNDIKNNNSKELKEEISKLKFQIKINQQKYINYQKTFKLLKNLHIENDLKYKRKYLDYIKKEKNLKEKYNQLVEKIFNDSKDKDIENDKKLNILKIKLQNLKENNYDLRKKIFNIKKENEELEYINNMREYELRELLFYQQNEINKLQDSLNNLKNNYSIIEEENENKIKELNNQIIIENNRLSNIKIVYRNKGYNHKKSSSSVFNNNLNLDEIDNKSESLLHSKSWNTYNIFKIKELKDKIKILENEIVNLNYEISEKTDKNERLAEEIMKLKNDIKNRGKEKDNNINKSWNIKEKFDDKKINDLYLIMNEHENNMNNIIKTYNLKMEEQNNEINKITSNYEQKIKSLLKKIKILNYEIYN